MNLIFAKSTIIVVNPAMGHEVTPVLLNPLYDEAVPGYIFIIDPAPYMILTETVSLLK